MSGSVRGGTGATPAHVRRAREKRVREEAQRTPFSEMTIAELRVYAQKYDIVGYAKLKKEELVEEVRVAFEGRK